jgi:hypothetical protein
MVMLYQWVVPAVLEWWCCISEWFLLFWNGDAVSVSGSWCSERTQCFSFQASKGLIGMLFFKNCSTLEDTRHYKKWKTNWCHCFNFIHISTDLYMFWAHRPILRSYHVAVHTTIGSVSVPSWLCALYVVACLRQATTYRVRDQDGTETEPMVVWTATWYLLRMSLWARNM